ncbi:MAG: hypothetical protein DMF73_11905 [Acidobacteria bacterium]|nr:MAG: hypothetical protein DMF73_11905 [Acidobacteriota bacterium]
MTRNRMEAFSDGVIAIIITIMVLELRVPAGSTLTVLRPITPVFFSYLLSFVFLGIYWSNHHHLLQVVEDVNGRVLWANHGSIALINLFAFLRKVSGAITQVQLFFRQRWIRDFDLHRTKAAVMLLVC